MTPSLRIGWLVLLCVLSRPGAAQSFDPAHTGFGFELRTHWGQRVVGTFPRYQGEVIRLADGKRQVRIQWSAAAVEVAGSKSYTAMARGPGFFDAARYPLIEFVSEPLADTVLHAGGRLRGRLSMHGVARNETFALEPSACARPGLDCDVIAHGSVRRDDYALDGWQFALRNQVRFDLRVRLLDEES